MHRLRRRSQRHHCYRAAKIKLRAGDRAHDCLLIDMSDGGVRLNIEGLDVPDEFVLLVSNGGKVQEGAYKMVWRKGSCPNKIALGNAQSPDATHRLSA